MKDLKGNFLLTIHGIQDSGNSSQNFFSTNLQGAIPSLTKKTVVVVAAAAADVIARRKDLCAVSVVVADIRCRRHIESAVTKTSMSWTQSNIYDNEVQSLGNFVCKRNVDNMYGTDRKMCPVRRVSNSFVLRSELAFSQRLDLLGPTGMVRRTGHTNSSQFMKTTNVTTSQKAPGQQHCTSHIIPLDPCAEHNTNCRHPLLNIVEGCFICNQCY